jgi:integrase
MAKANIKYLQEADGHLLYRRRVPHDLKAIIGKNEWIHALGLEAGQEAHAAKLVADYNIAYSSLIAQERVKQVTGSAALVIPQNGIVYAQPVQAQIEPQKPAVKISEAYAYDLKTHGGDRFEKVFKIAVDTVVEHLGDIDILTMTPKDVQIWIGKCAARGNKASTTRRRINALRAIINRYFREHEIEKRNPFSNPNIKDGGGTAGDRLPFNKDHLKLIDRYFAKAPKLTSEIRHIMALMKLTGARPMEIGGLDAADLILDHEIPHLWIRNNPHRRIKTKGSERRLPLIGDALIAAQAELDAKPKGALFSKSCHDSSCLSHRMNKMIRKAGVPKSRRLVAYSFRHTLEEAMRAAGVKEHTQKRILGHTDTSMTGRYGAPAGMLEELQQAIRIAEPLLGKVDPSIYSNVELGRE